MHKFNTFICWNKDWIIYRQKNMQSGTKCCLSTALLNPRCVKYEVKHVDWKHHLSYYQSEKTSYILKATLIKNRFNTLEQIIYFHWVTVHHIVCSELRRGQIWFLYNCAELLPMNYLVYRNWTPLYFIQEVTLWSWINCP